MNSFNKSKKIFINKSTNLKALEMTLKLSNTSKPTKPQLNIIIDNINNKPLGKVNLLEFNKNEIFDNFIPQHNVSNNIAGNNSKNSTIINQPFDSINNISGNKE